METEETEETDKKVYSSPTLIIHGTVAEITSGLSRGLHTDAAFPSHVHVRELTFS